jgi:hypothetical protein
MIVRGAFRAPWIDASHDERRRVFEAWLHVHRTWIDGGCRLLATMDDLSAEYSRESTNFYSVWEIPDPSLLPMLAGTFGETSGDGDIKLARYFSVDFAIGKPIVSMEHGLGGAQKATTPRAAGEFT